MLKCREACKLLSEAQDRKLTPRERLSLKLHLFACIHCRRYRKQREPEEVAAETALMPFYLRRQNENGRPFVFRRPLHL